MRRMMRYAAVDRIKPTGRRRAVAGNSIKSSCLNAITTNRDAAGNLAQRSSRLAIKLVR